MRLVSKEIAERKTWMDGLGLVNLMMNVVHLHLNELKLVRLVVLALDPLILKLSVVSAR